MDVAVGASESLFSTSFIIDKLPLYDVHKNLYFLVGIQFIKIKTSQEKSLKSPKVPLDD
jgi:hypothetical protein